MGGSFHSALVRGFRLLVRGTQAADVTVAARLDVRVKSGRLPRKFTRSSQSDEIFVIPAA
jgi:hypothetical protein